MRLQDVNLIFRLNREKYPTEKIISPHLNHHWEADLAQMSQLKDFNDGISFLLVIIDIFSRYLHVRALKTKKGSEVKKAFQDVFSEKLYDVSPRLR